MLMVVGDRGATLALILAAVDVANNREDGLAWVLAVERAKEERTVLRLVERTCVVR